MVEPKPEEEYVHYKGGDKRYRVKYRAIGNPGIDINDPRYKFLYTARNCEDAGEESPVLEQLVSLNGHPKGTLWIKGGELGVDYITYEMLYDTCEFPSGTIWSRSLGRFTDFKQLGGMEVKRFTRIQ